MQILDELIKDIPQQFLGKKNTEVLLRAIARQLQEVYQVFEDLNTKVDIDTATGQNLDYVGTIIPLTRKEAGELAGLDGSKTEMSDERYRQFLRYQNLVNTNECTYYDLMEGLRLLWGVSPIYYIEDPSLPATIILTMPFMKPGGENVLLGGVPMVKPAGVRIEFQYSIRMIIEIATRWRYSQYLVPLCGQLLCGQYPRRGSLGQFVFVESDVGLDQIWNVFDLLKTGTIRIGGKAYDATTGAFITDEVEIGFDKDFVIKELKLAGTEIAGTYPSVSSTGVLMDEDIEARSILTGSKIKLPLTGEATSGGGQMEQSIFEAISKEISVAPDVFASMAEAPLCGSGYKSTAKHTELNKAVSIDPVVTVSRTKVSRCGNKVCGSSKEGG